VRAGLASPLKMLRVDGGLAGNQSVLHAIADLSAVQLERTTRAEMTARGAGALAGIGTGLWNEATLAAMPAQPGGTVEPSLADHHRNAARKAWRKRLGQVVGRTAAGERP